MNTARKIAKNTGASFLTQVSTPLSSFVLVFFIARLLGPSGLGAYSSAFSLFFIFQAFASLGFSYLIIREVSQDRSKASKFLSNATFTAIIFSMIFGILMCGTIHLVTKSKDTIISVYILSLSLIPYAIALVSQSICNGFEKMEYVAVSQIMGNVFKMAVGTIFLIKGYGIVPLMFIILISYFLMSAISFLFAFKLTRESIRKVFKIDVKFCRWILVSTPVFAFIMILSSIRMNVDVLILNNLMGEGDVGLYSAASKLVNVFKLGMSCYIMAIQPVIFKAFVTSSSRLKDISTRSLRFLFILCIPITTMAVILNKKIILFVYKEQFLPSADVLSILIFIIIFYALNQIFANILVSSNNQKINLIANLIGMISNVAFNLILIPNFGYLGAAISSILSAFATFSYQYYFVSKSLFKIKFYPLYNKTLLSAIMMSVVALLFKNNSIFFVIFLSSVIFIMGMILLKAFTSHDINAIKRIWTGEKDLESVIE